MKRKRISDPGPDASKPPDGTDAALPEIPVVEVRGDSKAAPRIVVRPKAKTAKCVVCAEPCTANAVDDLCWVCRRLKLSAWRDTDAQMPAQE